MSEAAGVSSARAAPMREVLPSTTKRARSHLAAQPDVEDLPGRASPRTVSRSADTVRRSWSTAGSSTSPSSKIGRRKDSRNSSSNRLPRRRSTRNRSQGTSDIALPPFGAMAAARARQVRRRSDRRTSYQKIPGVQKKDGRSRPQTEARSGPKPSPDHGCRSSKDRRQATCVHVHRQRCAYFHSQALLFEFPSASALYSKTTATAFRRRKFGES